MQIGDDWALIWASSKKTLDHLLLVMKATFACKRHQLFFHKHERRGGGATYLSTLRQLSNPGYLWDVGLEDTAIVKHLKNVFLQFLPQSHNELMKLYSSNVRIADEYVDCVLFPETFIYHLQCEGMTREQADQAFTQQLEPSDHERQVHRQFKYGNSILFLRHYTKKSRNVQKSGCRKGQQFSQEICG